MIKKEQRIYVALGAALILSLAINGMMYNQLPRTAYVDIHQVFENFNGTKELEARLSHLENKQKSLLDTMGLNIRTMQSRISPDAPQAVLASLETQQRNFIALNNEFSQQYEAEDQQYTEMAWKQINQYIAEFGKENGYDYIYGSSGNGNMMYANNQKDITQTILEYINLKYEGI